MSTSKKPRHRHTSEQLEQLNSLYAIDEHPSLEQRQMLAEALGMETKTVNSWFQNKRASQAKKASRAASQNAHKHVADSDDDPDYSPSTDPSRSKTRNRLSAEQVDALRNSFRLNDMPTPAEREQLANQLGLSLQSVTNWFQNQRSLAKKSNPDEFGPEMHRQFSGFPPPPSHPSLPPLPPASTHPSIPSTNARPLSVSPETTSKNALRRSITPYAPSSSVQRRRARPEPHQLAALHSLYSKTSNPSIQDRTSLAVATGMDLDKVSNWFRNMRQTKKRRRRSESPDGDSEQGSHRSSSSPPGQNYDQSVRSLPTHSPESDMGSDEEDEAITPPPESLRGDSQETAPYTVPHPPPSSYPDTLDIPVEWLDNDPSAKADLNQRPRVDVEGALLLLAFHSCIVDA